MSQSDPVLWEYAEQCYALPGVEAISLELQDEYHANVNILLWCCWLETEGIFIAKKNLEEVLVVIDAVSEFTVQPLREIRRFLKREQCFTRVQTLVIKRHILKTELVIEEVLFNRLQDLTARFDRISNESEALKLIDYLKYLKIPKGQSVANKIIALCTEEVAAD